jgi:hypothetical protein
MKRRTHVRQALVLGLAAAVFSITGCASLNSFLPTSTPYPTYTRYPTFTPQPTQSPPRFEIRVISAEAVQNFGDFYIPEGSTTRMIHMSILYTFNGPGTAEFSPETVVLMNRSGTNLRGWGRVPALYRSEASGATFDLKEESTLTTLSPGTSFTDDFVWEWPTQYTEFTLYFPESEPIEVNIP